MRINENYIITNNNYLQNKKYNQNISFGKLEVDDTFKKQNEVKEQGFFDNLKSKFNALLGKMQGKYVAVVLSLLQKGYNDKTSIDYIDGLIRDFHKTPEGIRRVNMSDEEVAQKINDVYNKSFNELDIPEELRPELVIDSDKNILAGGYQEALNQLHINSNAYRNMTELDSIVMHEATHAKEALLRAGIPQKRVDELIRNKLVSIITDDKSEQYTLLCNPGTLSFINQPKMSFAMKEDFVQYADKNLFNRSQSLVNALVHYNTTKELYQKVLKPEWAVPITKNVIGLIRKDLKPIYENIEGLMKKHPDFQQQYKSKEEAFNALMDYSLALNSEYNLFTDNKVGGKFGTTELKVKELHGEELKQAEKSLIDNITAKKGNLLFSKEVNVYTSMVYQFCPEEVLAETTGRKFLIKNYEKEIEQGKKDGTLTADREKFLTLQIDLSKQVIEYRMAGAYLLEKCNELISNPENKELEELVNKKDKELENMKIQIRDTEKKLSNYDK